LNINGKNLDGDLLKEMMVKEGREHIIESEKRVLAAHMKYE